MSKRMGWEGLLYQGTAGSTASVLVEGIVTNVDYEKAPTRGNTTGRGDGTAPSIETSRVTSIKPTLTITCLNKPDNPALIAFRAAAATGAAIAVRTKDHATGKGFDGDVTLGEKEGQPLQGEQTLEFSAEATEEFRMPQLNV